MTQVKVHKPTGEVTLQADRITYAGDVTKIWRGEKLVAVANKETVLVELISDEPQRDVDADPQREYVNGEGAA